MRNHPRLSHRSTEFNRHAAGAINRLLNRTAELTIGVEGQPTALQRIIWLPIKTEAALVAGKSHGDCETAATGPAIFDIRVSGVSVGNFTFAAGQTEAAVTITEPGMPTSSILEIYAPAIPDATLADVSLTLAISR